MIIRRRQERIVRHLTMQRSLVDATRTPLLIQRVRARVRVSPNLYRTSLSLSGQPTFCTCPNRLLDCLVDSLILISMSDVATAFIRCNTWGDRTDQHAS